MNEMNFNHPNASLPEGVVERAVDDAHSVFRRALMDASPVPTHQFDCNSLLFGEWGNRRYVVYVRVTLDGDDVEGVGPIPGVLIDAAAELNAEPHLLRTHVTRGTRELRMHRYGREDFIRAVMTNRFEWNARRLGRRSVSNYARLIRNRVSRLKLDLGHERVHGPEGREMISLLLRAGNVSPWGGTISPRELMESAMGSGRYPIFTCSCGEPGCAGVFRDVLVIHEGERVLWKAWYARGRKIYVFNRTQYRNEILERCAEGIKWAQSTSRGLFGPYEDLAALERLHFDASDPDLTFPSLNPEW